MKKQCFILKIAILVTAIAVINACGNKAENDYPIRAVPFTEVSFSDQFWGPRLETNRTKTIPFAFKQCEETGRIANFEIAAGMKRGTFLTRYSFDDSDVYKIIEGASYSLAEHPDPALDKYLDELIAKIAAAQEKDGYLFTARTASLGSPIEMAGKKRWSNLQWSHELYDVGHLYEAAVAHFKATGKRTLLDVALKNADLIARDFGQKKLRLVPGHQEIEIGLTKLYRLTENKKYLNLAKFFLDERGNAKGHKLYGEYAQDHIPVSKQTEAVGHAVRAAYMYAGMADVAALTGNRSYVEAIDRLWENVVGRKIYLTGGIGATGAWEGFGPDYELPNASAYAETCASIANALWNYRMFLLHGDSKYIDVLERILYNGLLSGVSLSGDRFFYANPLASFGQQERSPWFTCACCPGNISRFIPSVPGYVYALSDDDLYINLFIQGKASIKTRASTIQVEQQTGYPWKGEVRIRISPEKPSSFTLHLRIPGWAQNQPIPSDLYRYLETSNEKPALKVNGEIVPLNLEKGYALMTRTWEKDSTIELSLPMPIRRVIANDAVKADRGRVAVERGPVVYCAEWPDNMGYVRNIVLEDGSPLSAEFRPELLNGVEIIAGEATGYLSKGARIISQKQKLTLIPYYAWAHRGKGEMEVWLSRQREAVMPLPEPSIASTSRAIASGGRGIEALNDQFEPESSNDHSTGYFHWWPKKGTLEWVQYDFKDINRVSEVSVYWFDDTGSGECRVPKSWRVLYKSGGKWLPVKNLDSYGVEKDKYNTVRFSPVQTQGLRLEIQLPEKFSSGIQEWKVK
jgi:DUF1680 family protein